MAAETPFSNWSLRVDDAAPIPLGGASIVVGRDGSADLVLDGNRVSRRHAEIRWVGDALEVEDLGSSNGTNLNGLPLLDATRLSAGDVIEIGGHRIELLPPASAAKAARAQAPAVVPPRAAPPSITPDEAPRTGKPSSGRSRARWVATAGVVVAVGIAGYFATRPKAASFAGPTGASSTAEAPSGSPDASPASPPAAVAERRAPPPTPGEAADNAPTVPSEAVPSTPAANGSDARRALEEALAARRFIEADRLASGFGPATPEASALSSALQAAADAAEAEFAARRDRDGQGAAVAWLRQELNGFPRDSAARKQLTNVLLGAPTARPPTEKPPETAATRPNPVRPGNGKPKAGEKPPAAPPAGSPVARETPPKTEPPSPPTPPERRLPGQGEEVAPHAEKLAAARAALEQAEKALKDRDLAAATAGFEAVATATPAGAAAASSRWAEVVRRAERGRRSVAQHEAVHAALARSFGADPGKAGQIPAGDGTLVPCLGVDAEGITLGGPKGEQKLRWRVVATGTLRALVKKAELLPSEFVPAAGVLRALGSPDDGVALLSRAFRKDAGLKPAIDQELADARGMPDVPVGGFTLEGERWLSPREIERERLSVQIDAAAERLASDDPKTRAAAIKELKDLGEPARAGFHRGVMAARIKLHEKLLSVKGYPQLAALAAAREELDQRRATALELILDEKRYPYPYRAPEASPEAVAAYQESQPEIDKRVALVRELWKVSKPVAIPPPIRPLVQRLVELQGIAKDAELGELPPEPGWLLHLPAGNEVELSTIATTAAERERIDGSAKILVLNDTEFQGATPNEQAQCRITNEYRLMLGRWALRLHAPLIRAAHGHCEDMVRLGFFSHTSPVPGKESFVDRVRREGCNPFGCSENIAVNTSPQGAHNAWCHSSGHHRNLLNQSWRLMGPGNSGNKWCQVFSIADRADGGAGTADGPGPEGTGDGH